MSSNAGIYYRVCKYCSIEFIAEYAITKHCSIECRFEDKYLIKDNGCWNWKTGQPGTSPHFNIGGGKTMPAARYSYIKYIGDIPDGYSVIHNCDNKSCINPEHLFIGTEVDLYNIKDKYGKGQKGEQMVTHKLTEKDVIAIRKDDRTAKQIAKDYNTSRHYIHIIKSKKKWAWLKND